MNTETTITINKGKLLLGIGGLALFIIGIIIGFTIGVCRHHHYHMRHSNWNESYHGRAVLGNVGYVRYQGSQNSGTIQLQRGSMMGGGGWATILTSTSTKPTTTK